jgi:peptidoglycan L-alanyl-D-glutamate endopeptidase CwlK
MPYDFSNRSLERLRTCHADLILLMTEALMDPECPCDFTVLEGHRGKERQNQMVEEGKSQLPWPKSRHNAWPSLAVDVAPWIDGAVSWDWKDYHPLADHIRSTWNRLTKDGRTTGQYTYQWGGTWTSLPDGPHHQLDPL